jgi:hypothetical protein
MILNLKLINALKSKIEKLFLNLVYYQLELIEIPEVNRWVANSL